MKLKRLSKMCSINKIYKFVAKIVLKLHIRLPGVPKELLDF